MWYKLNAEGKVCKIRQTQVGGCNLEATNVALRAMLPDNQKSLVSVTPEEEILAQTNFNQGDIRRAFRSIIVTPEVVGSELVPATETTPEIPAVVAVPAVTLEPVLDALIASSPQMTADWRDEKTINLNDPRVAYALSLANPPIDVQAIKAKIAHNN